MNSALNMDIIPIIEIIAGTTILAILPQLWMSLEYPNAARMETVKHAAEHKIIMKESLGPIDRCAIPLNAVRMAIWITNSYIKKQIVAPKILNASIF